MQDEPEERECFQHKMILKTIGRIGTLEVEPVEEFSTSLAGFLLQFAPNGAFTANSTFEN